MPVKLIESDKGNFVQYIKKSNNDVSALKMMLSSLANGVTMRNRKDIIVDFFDLNTISSAKIGFLVSIAKLLMKDNRKLILLASPKLKALLESTNVNRITNLVIQNNQMDLKPKVPVEEQHEETEQELRLRTVKISCPTCSYELYALPEYISQGFPNCPCGSTMRQHEEAID